MSFTGIIISLIQYFLYTVHGHFSRLADMGPLINTIPYNETLIFSRSELPQRLVCDFASPCAYSPDSLGPHWVKINTLDAYWDQWQSAMSTSSSPTAPFIAVDLASNSPFAVLKSQDLPCLQDEADVMFSFWASHGVTMQVCIVKIDRNENLVCSPVYSSNSTEYPSFSSFKFHGSICEPFRIEYMAMTEPGSNGFLLLDDLGFFGTICDNPADLLCSAFTTTAGSVVSVPVTATVSRRKVDQTDTVSVNVTEISRISRIIPHANICQAIDCDFSANMCSYRNFEGALAWSRSSNELENANNYFLQVTLHHNHINHVAVISSPRFTPSVGKQISFKYFRAIPSQGLKVCFETYPNPQITDVSAFENCAEVVPAWNFFTALTWNSHTVSVPPDAYMVNFVAYLEDSNFLIALPLAIDDIKIDGCT